MLQYLFNLCSAPEYLNTVYVRAFMAFFYRINRFFGFWWKVN